MSKLESNAVSLQEHIEGVATSSEGETPRLALRPKEATKALGIGARLLWSMTNRGEIPHIRIGKAVLYPVDELKRWMAEQAQKKGGWR